MPYKPYNPFNDPFNPANPNSINNPNHPMNPNHQAQKRLEEQRRQEQMRQQQEQMRRGREQAEQMRQQQEQMRRDRKPTRSAEKLEKLMHCPLCGQQNREGALFCYACGESLDLGNQAASDLSVPHRKASHDPGPGGSGWQSDEATIQGSSHFEPQASSRMANKRRLFRHTVFICLALAVVLIIVAGSIALLQPRVSTPSKVTSRSTPTTVPTPTATTAPTPTIATTPTTSTSGNTSPSGLTIDPSAASIITNPQTASAVDTNYRPTNVTTTFKTGQTIYTTFSISSSASGGYVQAKWYSNGKYAFSSRILAVQGNFLGYLSADYNIATQGTVEMYWCVQSDCSDAKLAGVITFTVS